MTSDQFHVMMVAIGFGFGSLFWLVLFYAIFGGRK